MRQPFSDVIKKAPFGEVFVVAFILVSTVYMWIEAFSFPEDARYFPLFATTATLIALGMFLVFQLKEYFPDPISRGLSMIEEMKADPILQNRFQDEADDSPESGEKRTLEWRSTVAINAYFLIGFIVLGYLIGLFWAAPLYAVTYGIWSNQNRYVIIMLTLLYMGITYMFEIYFRIGAMEGILQ